MGTYQASYPPPYQFHHTKIPALLPFIDAKFVFSKSYYPDLILLFHLQFLTRPPAMSCFIVQNYITMINYQVRIGTLQPGNNDQSMDKGSISLQGQGDLAPSLTDYKVHWLTNLNSCLLPGWPFWMNFNQSSTYQCRIFSLCLMLLTVPTLLLPKISIVSTKSVI